MSNEEEIQRKMAAIGVRYLARTATEIGDLQKMVARLGAADTATPKETVLSKTVFREIEVLAHRIRGSGAVFGFAGLSDAASSIEMLAVECSREESYDAARVMEQFTAHIAKLASETQHAQTAASA
jgi:HPt (histidine-containing phosphotransfer) domain-containing protein